MFTKIFKQINSKSVDIAGGKGASLGEMTSADIPVPPGFVVLADSFDRFLADTDLNVEVDSIIGDVNHEDVNSVNEASVKINDLINDAEFPEDIGKEIKKQFKELNAEYVAVRSSATAEDSSIASWAGELDSYLNVTSDNLFESVKKCWASLFTPRAIFYRFEKGLEKEKVSVAVVVQKMVQSEISGITFTVHPVTQDEDQMIIEAGYGLGEAIVGGMITPDSYVIDKSDMSIMDINISKQDKQIVKSEKGTDITAVKSEDQEKQKLDGKQIIELAKICIDIEKHYGFPCDIEWTYERGKFYIVQSRPITTLTKSKPVGKKEDYIFIYRFKKLPYLVSDFLMQGYAKHEPFFYYINGFWYAYFPKGKYEEALNEGLDNIKSKGWVEKYDLEYKQLISKSLDFEKVLNNESKLSEERLNKFLDYIKILLTYYYHLDHFSTDKVFAESEKNKSLKPSVNKMGEMKYFFRERINEIFFYPESLLKKYLQKISKNCDIPFEILYSYSVEEMGKVIDGFELPEKEIQKRSTQYAMYYDGKEYHYFTGKESQTKIDEIHEEPESDDTLKGIPANKGKVTAKARVLEYTLEDFGKTESLIKSMKKGEILVTETTGPEIIVACNKASAIVTDEGGLLSHAAIVSRELGIPCIVGTKFATSLIKTGDEIEVDADNGIAKIIS